MASRGADNYQTSELVPYGTDRRLRPPDTLGDSARRIFVDLVASLPSGHFKAGDISLLCRYCEAAAYVTDKRVKKIKCFLNIPYKVALKVASTCVLSQLIEVVIQSVGVAHPRFLELVQAVRIGHLRLLMHLVAPARRRG